ncbi:MAG: c-type cytochrome [Dehalococcoidia bacterium]
MLHALRRGPGIFIGVMLIIWVGLPLVPEQIGLRFGMGYKVFFTAMVLLSALLFWFLRKDRISHPQSTAGVLVSLAAVFLLTVGLLVTAGVVYPQFELPRPPEAAAQEAAERGEEIFWSGSAGCFRCHAISGTGGTRGPDLTQVASRAGQRVPDLSAKQYLLEKIGVGGAYQFTVPEYVPMMPQFEKTLTAEQLQDLVAFLLSRE